MKGIASMPEDIGMTVLFLVVIVVMMLIVFLLFLKLKIPTFDAEKGFGRGELITYQIDFLSIANKPFLLADVLTSMGAGDRSILEKSMEAAAVGSLDKAKADDLPEAIEGFVKQYNLRYYSVTVKSGGKELARVESDAFRCGERKEGWCVLDKGDQGKENCDVGRVEIDDAGLCRITEVCCAFDKDRYLGQGKHNFVTCGNNGVCSAGRHLTIWAGLIPITTGPFCDTGQLYLGTPDVCTGANDGNTPVCCAPATEENIIGSAGATRAVVPLLFKGAAGTLEVTAK